MGRSAHTVALLLPALVLPVLAFLLGPAGEPYTLAVAGLIAVALAVAGTSRPILLPVVTASAGPPGSARRCLRGSFLPQSNPDTPGRPRPRAPGGAPG